jgi:hypothetical protein
MFDVREEGDVGARIERALRHLVAVGHSALLLIAAAVVWLIAFAADAGDAWLIALGVATAALFWMIAQYLESRRLR